MEFRVRRNSTFILFAKIKPMSSEDLVYGILAVADTKEWIITSWGPVRALMLSNENKPINR